MCGKKLYPSHNAEYLGVYLDEYLKQNWGQSSNFSFKWLYFVIK